MNNLYLLDATKKKLARKLIKDLILANDKCFVKIIIKCYILLIT